MVQPASRSSHILGFTQQSKQVVYATLGGLVLVPPLDVPPHPLDFLHLVRYILPRGIPPRCMAHRQQEYGHNHRCPSFQLVRRLHYSTDADPAAVCGMPNLIFLGCRKANDGAIHLPDGCLYRLQDKCRQNIAVFEVLLGSCASKILGNKSQCRT